MAIVDPFEQQGSVTVKGATGIVDPFENTAKAEADSIAASKISKFDYIANQAKLGLTDSAVLGEALIDTFVTQPFKGLITGKQQPTFGENVKRLQKAAGTVTGATEETKAPDVLTEIAGGAARMMTDPLGYVGGGMMKAGTGIVEKAGQVAARAGGLFGMGATGTGGGIVGAETEKAITGQDTGTGRAIGSIAGVLSGVPAATAVTEGTAAATNMVQQLWNKYQRVKADPDGANQAYASGAAKRLLEIIAKEQPGQKLDEIVTEFNRIGNVINKQDVPLMVAMADNPAVRNQVERLVKENPAFRQRVNTELETLATSIDKQASSIFGERYTPVSGIRTPLTKELNNAVKAREAIENRIDDLTTRFIPGMDQGEIGAKIENLVNARKQAVTAEMKPVYTSVLEDAKKAGAKLPDTAVRDIYGFVISNNMRDIFGKGTKLDNAIIKNFGPKEGEFFPASFEAVDSLKRELNALQRGRLTADEARKLSQLEDVVDASRQQIKGNFNQRLIDADRLYYEKIGVPFSAQGIKDIDSKKYAEQVAPVIIKNESSLKQFLNVAGDQGTEIARNAVYADAYNKVIKNDALDPKALSRYLQKNEAVLNRLPGVKEELQKSLFDDSALKIARKDIDDKVKITEKRIADNFILSVKDADGVAVPNYSQLADRLFSDPNFYGKITKDLKALDKKTAESVTNSIRAEIVEKARNSTDGGVGFLTNPKNARVINQIFGSGYQSSVKDLLKISDALNKADINKIGTVVTRSDLDALAKIVPGLDIPYVTSTLRDRISSSVQKSVRLLSRMQTAKLKTATDDALSELLLDPQGLKKLQSVSNTFDFKLQNPTSIKKIADTISSVLPRYVYGAAKEATMLPPEAGTPQPQVQFGTFEGQ